MTTHNSEQMIDKLIGFNGQNVQAYFIPSGYGIAFIVRSYLHYLCICVIIIFLHTILSDMLNNRLVESFI